jgi:tetratricopeptide (TPR) repeat protein
MRVLFFVCFVGFAGVLAAQDFVSSAIISYHAGAYERCIEDLNKALKNSSSLEPATRAKAYFYRGMARLKLTPSSISMLILDDLVKAKNLDNQWNERANVEIQRIVSQVIQSAQADYDKALQSRDPNVNRPLLSGASDRLYTCLEVARYPAALELMAKISQTHGDVYYNMAEMGDPMEVQRQFMAHYTQAITYYEEWLNTQEGTKAIFNALKVMAGRIEDRERESRYAYLVEQIGG